MRWLTNAMSSWHALRTWQTVLSPGMNGDRNQRLSDMRGLQASPPQIAPLGEERANMHRPLPPSVRK